MDDEFKKLSALKLENEKLIKKIKEMKRKLAMTNSVFLSMVGKSLDGVVIIDKSRMVIYANYAAIQLFDRNIADLLGQPLDIFVDLDQMSKESEVASEIHIPKADGTFSVSEITVLKSEWNNEPCYVVCLRDVTEKKSLQNMLEFMSHHDPLTELPNRNYFEKEIVKSIEGALKNQEHMALLYLDLDNFKEINDQMGHSIGDLVLKHVSRELSKIVRKKDTIARIGGDEFVIIVPDLRKPEYAKAIVEKIFSRFEGAVKCDGHRVKINLSVGVAVYPFSGTTPKELVINADNAMYEAKKSGKNQYKFHDKIEE